MLTITIGIVGFAAVQQQPLMASSFAASRAFNSPVRGTNRFVGGNVVPRLFIALRSHARKGTRGLSVPS